MKMNRPSLTIGLARVNLEHCMLLTEDKIRGQTIRAQIPWNSQIFAMTTYNIEE